MSAPLKIANSEGGLYELLARGNKDVFFYQDLPDSKFIFDNTFQPQAPYSYEIRKDPPSTSCEFGRMVEFPINMIGDLMNHPTLLINLPSWLPPTYANTNPTTQITDLSGYSYGYVNGIAYFLFERIQLFQDNILLQEFSGDSLWAIGKTEGTYGHGWVTSKLHGEHNGSSLSIQRNATPGHLRLELPLIGTQGSNDSGFPQRAATSHTYKLRCKLRKLEELVECSQPLSQCEKPVPWGKTFQQVSSSNGTPQHFNTLPRENIPPILLQLETQQIYTTKEIQEALQSKKLQVPFRRVTENVFSQNKADYISVIGGGTGTINRRLDGRHPSGRILFYFRSLDDIQANRWWKIGAGTSEDPYYKSISLTIAGQTRELPRTPLVWRDITNFAKEDLDTGIQMNTMNWTLGAVAPLRFPQSSLETPTGTVNFTTADRPNLYIDLANPQATTPATQLYVIAEGWAVFQTDKGRAELYNQN
jgi:hypothetical protein